VLKERSESIQDALEKEKVATKELEKNRSMEAEKEQSKQVEEGHTVAELHKAGHPGGAETRLEVDGTKGGGESPVDSLAELVDGGGLYDMTPPEESSPDRSTEEDRDDEQHSEEELPELATAVL
jgi:hypothetical protein